MYIGMLDYDAGVAAAEAALEIIGSGQVVGLVGFATAQNAQDRIAGVNDTLEGTDLEMVEVLYDDVKPEVALSNAQTAIQKYPDLAGFITFYSYDGPAAGQAVKQAGKEGQIKIVAFDAEPETEVLPMLVDAVRLGKITEEVGGLALYNGGEGARWLIASNASAGQLFVYDHSRDDAFAGALSITSAGQAVGEPGALFATSSAIGADKGAIIVGDEDASNYKIISFGKIASWRSSTMVRT